MPIYEYKCEQCNERHEIIQRYSEDPLEHCPKCGGAMKKLISSPAIQFKGSGFYKTDYPSSTSSAASSKVSGSTSETKGESKGESKSETKSETKTETKSEAPATKSETKASD
jgi:putative FmdB family regulatory protein